jgi:hypothetical protein
LYGLSTEAGMLVQMCEGKVAQSERLAEVPHEVARIDGNGLQEES